MIDTLKTFGINICQWFLENKDAIIAFFLSGQFVTLVLAAVKLIKTTKEVKNNTKTGELLNAALNDNISLKNSLTAMSENFTLLKNENDSLRNELKITENKISETNTRILDSLNAMLEVQSVVYSTIRDDETRNTVNKLLNNARYADKNFKLELQHEIESMRKDFENKVAEISNTMNNSIDKVNESINFGVSAEPDDRAETLRY